jgi:hypothetical protein
MGWTFYTVKIRPTVSSKNDYRYPAGYLWSFWANSTGIGRWHDYVALSGKLHVMRTIIHDDISHKFIEGPFQLKFGGASTYETATYSSDQPQPSESEEGNVETYDRDIPFVSMNERED